MSIVGDLREALQDVVTPDLKAVVRGLSDLKEEMRSSNALLREEMQNGNALLRREIEQAREEARENTAVLREEMQGNIAQLRDEMQNGNALLRREIEQSREEARENTAVLREDTRQHIALLREEAKASEARSVERMQHLQDALKLALVTQRALELEKQLEQIRSAQQSQQH